MKVIDHLIIFFGILSIFCISLTAVFATIASLIGFFLFLIIKTKIEESEREEP